MRVPRTLRGRLALAALVASTVWIVALTVAVNVVVRHQLEATAVDVAATRAQDVANGVTVDGQGQLLRPNADEAHELAGTAWVFAGTALVDASARSSPYLGTARLLAGTSGAVLTSETPSAVVYASAGVDLGHQQIGTVVAAVPLLAYERDAELTLIGTSFGGVLTLGFIYLLARLLLGRALRPVEDMTRQSRSWAAQGTPQRFAATSAPTELRELADTLDELLDRLAAVLRRERLVTAEISHELRTPLAAAIGEAELSLSRPRTSDEARRSMESVRDSARRMNDIVNTLLHLARTPSHERTAECVVGEVVRDAVGGLGEARVPVVVSGDTGVLAAVDRAVLARMMNPLLENATRFARSRVDVVVAAQNRQVEVRVSDDGPGVAPDIVDQIFEPGSSRDPAGRHQGAGLGLALARRLARDAGGDVIHEPGPGGAVLTAVLPRG